MLPVIAILATASVLSLLQSHSEIVVIRAAGWSVHRLAQTALLPLAVAIGVAFVISQWLAPQLHQPGGPLFGQAVGDRGIWHERHGLWLREDDRYLNVRELRLGQVPSDIHLFEFNDDGGLARYIQAREAAKASLGTQENPSRASADVKSTVPGVHVSAIRTFAS
jgi:lipopolysaccharide export system permease protein